jgi:hypothetical protein
MPLKLYDRVTLKNGLSASIVEILGDGKCYVADIDYPDGETATEFVNPDEILSSAEQISQTAVPVLAGAARET